MSTNDKYNEKWDIIKNLLLDEKAIGEAAVFKVTVLQSVIEYERTDFANDVDFQNAVAAALGEMRPFSPRQRSSLSEGFLDFSAKDNVVDLYYIREVAFRWEYVDSQKGSIQSFNVKRVDPSYRVRINILFEANKVTMTFFGGMETLDFRARDVVCDAVKKLTYNFATKDVKFSPKDMRNILARFGKYVALINIDPRDNEKFSKIVERQMIGKAEVKKVILYDVFNVRMTGVQITISPEVTRLIKEEGIRITEISGGLWLKLGIKITTRVKSNGRVEFIIPSKHYGTDTQVIYDTAVKLYGKITPSEAEPEKGPLEKYF
jgi:hypothetical protein